MIGLVLRLLQLLFLAGVILVGLKFLSPDMFHKITGMISDQTGIEREALEDNLDKAKNVVVKTTEVAAKTAKEAIAEEMSK